MNSWQDEIRKIFSDKEVEEDIKQGEMDSLKRQSVGFIIQTVLPAFNKLSRELKQYNRILDINSNDADWASVTVREVGKRKNEFYYSIEVPFEAQQETPIVEIRFNNKEDGRAYTANPPLRDETKDYSINDITKDEIINNFISLYKMFI
jgi:hypothetical protein